MIQGTELIEKREEVKRRLGAGEYKSLVRMIANKINLVLQKSARSEPLPFWFGIVMMVIIIYLLERRTRKKRIRLDYVSITLKRNRNTLERSGAKPAHRAIE